jgi:lupus La protein
MEGDDQLKARIKKQVEFYFSDGNYPRDKFLRAEAAKNPEGYIPIATVAAFPRLAAISNDVPLITEVMKTANGLQVSEDGTMVKRTAPLPESDTSMERSIYAKGFPTDESVTLEKLEELFFTVWQSFRCTHAQK